jgi:Lrp/AsnC family leucine-responsive transcriptional regulator
MIDDVDAKILTILQQDARASSAEIARQIGMAPSAIHERMRKLEARGVIEGYETRINADALGLGLTAFIFVRANERVGQDQAGAQLAALPEVQEVHHVAGEDCYLVKVRVADTHALGRLLREGFGSVDAVITTRSTIVLSTLKETANLPIRSTDEADHD